MLCLTSRTTANICLEIIENNMFDAISRVLFPKTQCNSVLSLHRSP